MASEVANHGVPMSRRTSACLARGPLGPHTKRAGFSRLPVNLVLPGSSADGGAYVPHSGAMTQGSCPGCRSVDCHSSTVGLSVDSCPLTLLPAGFVHDGPMTGVDQRTTGRPGAHALFIKNDGAAYSRSAGSVVVSGTHPLTYSGRLFILITVLERSRCALSGPRCLGWPSRGQREPTPERRRSHGDVSTYGSLPCPRWADASFVPVAAPAVAILAVYFVRQCRAGVRRPPPPSRGLA